MYTFLQWLKELRTNRVQQEHHRPENVTILNLIPSIIVVLAAVVLLAIVATWLSADPTLVGTIAVAAVGITGAIAALASKRGE